MRGPWGAIVDQIGGELDPDDPLIALSRQRDVERRERLFPSHLRRQLNEALGIEPESPFARLMRERGAVAEAPLSIGAPSSEVTRQQAEDQARRERQRRAEARKEKQKRKASSAARKANRKKGK
jgi:hypothetical protein